MAILHQTTLTPGKLELLAAWLPRQPWYRRGPGLPRLDRAGSFRLDDPDGAVGIEFMVATETGGGGDQAYLAPLTYRGAPLAGQDADRALIGTAEHGVLGLRYVYDGVRDPVLVRQLIALLNGQVLAQAQRVSDTPDPSVTARLAGSPIPVPTALAVTDGADGTAIAIGSGPVLRVARALAPGDGAAAARGYVEAGWSRPDGSPVRGPFVTVSQ